MERNYVLLSPYVLTISNARVGVRASLRGVARRGIIACRHDAADGRRCATIHCLRWTNPVARPVPAVSLRCPDDPCLCLSVVGSGGCSRNTGRSMFGRRTFSVAGRAAWNSLPDYPRDPSRPFDSFRRDLETFLFSSY